LWALGLSPQKPKRVAYQQNPAAVKKFLHEEYPAIKQLTGDLGAKIYWGDEASIRSDYHRGTTWAKKGETPVLKTTGVRFSSPVKESYLHGSVIPRRNIDKPYQRNVKILPARYSQKLSTSRFARTSHGVIQQHIPISARIRIFFNLKLLSPPTDGEAKKCICYR
jgi:hypothetical protein